MRDHNTKAPSINHHLVLDELPGCTAHLFGDLIPFTGYTLEASTRKPFGDLSH
jgi:hypothetical protein